LPRRSIIKQPMKTTSASAALRASVTSARSSAPNRHKMRNRFSRREPSGGCSNSKRLLQKHSTCGVSA